jgi:DNA repair photolyase
MEPRTSSPKQRLDTIRLLAEAGIPVGSLLAPVIPGLTDTEMPAIIEAVADAGATFASYIALRLPLAVAPLFETWLDEHYPDQKDKILNRVRSMRGGNLYNSEFDQRMKGTGFHADQLQGMFNVYTHKHGLNRGRAPMTTEHFRVPLNSGDQIELC